MTERQTIINQADLRKWRTEIPNMYDDAGLDPFAFRLLVHYVRVGSCWESTRTTAKKCGMSPAQVVGKRRELAEGGWITLGENKKGTIQIEIVDRWAENFKTYCSPDKQQPAKRSPRKRKRSPHEQKKEPIKNKPEIEETTAQKPRDLLFDAISEVCHVDPTTAGASIGNVKVALLKAKPPYTPEEVRAFGVWHDSDKWRKDKGPPSLWALKEKIGLVRETQSPNSTKRKVEVFR